MYYNTGLSTATTFLTFYVALIATVLTGLAPTKVLWYAQAVNIPVILVAKVANHSY